MSNIFTAVRKLFTSDVSLTEAVIPVSDIIRTAVGVLINCNPGFFSVSKLPDDPDFLWRSTRDYFGIRHFSSPYSTSSFGTPSVYLRLVLS